jgi:hypothetical protein
MKIGIICFWDRTATPYLRKYELILNKLGLDYEVIFWDRSCNKIKKEDQNEIYLSIDPGKFFLSKIVTFTRWRIQIKRVLKNNNYDFLIILTTYPAVLIADLLLSKFRGNFVFDIRDYSMEKFLIFRKITMKIIEASAFTTISSRGFLKWLDYNDKICLNHNITHSEFFYNRQSYFDRSDKIRICLVGNVRLDRQTEAMLISLKSSKKFLFGFIGRKIPSCNLEDVCKKNRIDNYYLKGEFTWKDKPEIYKDVDFINAVYANSDLTEKLTLGDSTPLPNRIYDAAIFKCPIIASKGTYLEELVIKYNLGISVNGFESDIEERLNEYINTFNKDDFEQGCNRFLADVLMEEEKFRNNLIHILNSKNKLYGEINNI